MVLYSLRGRSRADAEASQPPTDMLAAMIARGEIARARYLARLAEPGLAGPQRTRLRHLLLVLDGRLAHLRAQLAAQPEAPREEPGSAATGRTKRGRASYRNFLPRTE